MIVTSSARQNDSSVGLGVDKKLMCLMIPAGNIDYLDSLAFFTELTQLSKSNFCFSKSLG